MVRKLVTSIGSITAFASLVAAAPINAQERLSIDGGTSFSGEIFIGSEVSNGVVVFDKIPEVEDKIRRILTSIGTSDNLFQSFSGTVDSAAALLNGTQKLIVYNPDFLDRLAEQCDPEYAVLGVLAHEIGHHFHDHGFRDESVYLEELQADRFSGVYLARFGATLEQAKCALELFSSVEETSLHPSRSDRLAALSVGYSIGTLPEERRDAVVDDSDAFRSTGTIVAVQQALNSLGYAAGPVDGIFGSNTEAALAIFQKQNDLPTTGRIDETTYDFLQNRAEMLGTRSLDTTQFASNMAGVFCRTWEENVENGLIDETSISDPNDRIRCYEVSVFSSQPRFRVLIARESSSGVMSAWKDITFRSLNEFSVGKFKWELRGDELLLDDDGNEAIAVRSGVDWSRF